MKSTAASVYFALMFFVAGPALILHASKAEPFATGGIAWMLVGGAVIVAANLFVAMLVGVFIREGDGTHVPIDPPRRFVRSLAYRHARNPMYLAYVATVVGEAIVFRSAALFVYAAGLFLVAHLYVVHREEPLLERRFGDEYRDYCARVPRWGWRPSGGAVLEELAAGGDATTRES